MALYIRRMINLEQSDYWTVRRVVQEKGLGAKGFSAALRLIIREWAESNLPKPAHSSPDYGEPQPAADPQP